MARGGHLGGSTQMGFAGLGPGESWSTRNRALEKQGGYKSSAKQHIGIKNKTDSINYLRVRDKMLKLNFHNQQEVVTFLLRKEARPFFNQLACDRAIIARFYQAHPHLKEATAKQRKQSSAKVMPALATNHERQRRENLSIKPNSE